MEMKFLIFLDIQMFDRLTNIYFFYIKIRLE